MVLKQSERSVRPESVQRVKTAGYLLKAKDIMEKLRISSSDEQKEMLLSTGHAVIESQGLWPTSAFVSAFHTSKKQIPMQRIREWAGELEKPSDVFALSLVCPEIIDDEIRRITTRENVGKLPGNNAWSDPFDTARFIASYFGGADKPWNSGDSSKLADIIFNILNDSFERIKERKGCRDLYEKYAVEYGGANGAFSGAVHVVGALMPAESLRLSFDLPKDGIRERIKRISDFLGNLVSRRYHVSAKFNSSDLMPANSSTRQILMYVPTLSLPFVLNTAERSGLFDGEIRRDVELDNIGKMNSCILLPDYAVLRTTGEAALSSNESLVQRIEAIHWIDRLGINHRFIS